MDAIAKRNEARSPEPKGRMPGLPGQAPPGISGRDIIRILRKRVWMIVITALVVTAVCLAGTLVWRLYAPFYTAVARLSVNPPRGSELAKEVRLYNQDITNRLMRTQANLVLSNPVLTAASRNPKVVKTAWFKKNRLTAIERLAEDLRVGPVGGTNMIQVSLTAVAVNENQKTDLAEIVNAVAEEFEKFSRGNVSQATQKDIDNLQVEKNNLEENLTSIHDMITRTRPIANLQQLQAVLAIEMQRVTTELVRWRPFAAQSRAALEAFNRQVQNGSIEAAAEVLQALDMDPSLRMLRNAEVNLLTEQSRLPTKFGPQHDAVKNVEDRLTAIRSQIVERENLVKTQAVLLLQASRTAALESAVAQMVALQEQFDGANSKSRDLQIAVDKIEQLIGRQDKVLRNIGAIDGQLVELRLRAGGGQQVAVAISAIPPRDISMPRWLVMAPLSMLLGIAAGLGLAFAVELVDTSISNPSDIANRVNLPLLGVIPHVDDIDEEIDNLPLAFRSHPGSLMSEAFRQIRTRLMFSGPASEQKCLLITSAMPEDGRTTVAVNLGACIADSGQKVLVLDANFRQPAIRKLFPDCPDGGLSSALVGQAKWTDLVHEVHPGLHVMPAGTMPPNPTELLGFEQTRQMLADMAGQYDKVLIDGSPCLVVSDSVVLSRLVDGVILTVRAGTNTTGVVQRVRDMLLGVGAHVVGVAMNGVRAYAGGYLRRNYDMFYEYQEPR